MESSPANSADFCAETLSFEFRVACDHCASGILRPTRIRSAFWRGESLVIVENIPAMTCPDCGEDYVADPTVVQLDQMRGNGFGGLKRVKTLNVPVFDFGGRG